MKGNELEEKAREIFQRQAVCLSKRGNDITLAADSADDAEVLYDWLESLAAPGRSEAATEL